MGQSGCVTGWPSRYTTRRLVMQRDGPLHNWTAGYVTGVWLRNRPSCAMVQNIYTQYCHYTPTHLILAKSYQKHVHDGENRQAIKEALLTHLHAHIMHCIRYTHTHTHTHTNSTTGSRQEHREEAAERRMAIRSISGRPLQQQATDSEVLRVYQSSNNTHKAFPGLGNVVSYQALLRSHALL